MAAAIGFKDPVVLDLAGRRSGSRARTGSSIPCDILKRAGCILLHTNQQEWDRRNATTLTDD